MSYIFISYSHKDNDYVHKLQEALQNEGFDVWIDDRINYGKTWPIVIQRHLDNCGAFIVVMTEHAYDSEWVQNEVTRARRKKKPFFALLLRGDTWLSFEAIQYEDVSGERLPRKKFYEDLASVIPRAAAERALREKLEREAAKKAQREKAEREAAEKAAREKAKRDAAEKAKRARAERRVAQISTIKAVLSESFNTLKVALSKAKPLLGVGGILGIIFALVWAGSWAMSIFFSPNPTATPNSTTDYIVQQTLQALTSLAQTPTVTRMIQPSAIPIQTQASTATPTRTRVVSIPSLPAGATQISVNDGMVRVYIPEGVFIMGTDKAMDECNRIRNDMFAKLDPGIIIGGLDKCDQNDYINEEPPHQVYLDAFWIDITEVTNAMYAKCVSVGACPEPVSLGTYNRSNYYEKYPKHPVVNVLWSDADDYCTWTGGRLPTEAEWEKAARSIDDRIYPWGNTLPSCSYHANCSASNFSENTVQVASYPNGASPYGVMDMAGNVSEFVADWYSENYYSQSPELNPTGPGSGQYHVLRGGAFYSIAMELRTTARRYIEPTESREYVGFRCVAVVTP